MDHFAGMRGGVDRCDQFHSAAAIFQSDGARAGVTDGLRKISQLGDVPV